MCIYKCFRIKILNYIWITVINRNSTSGKSLNDFFIDRKVDGVIRDILPIIFSDEQNAAFIPGCGVSELYKVTESTEAILEIGFYPDVK